MVIKTSLNEADQHMRNRKVFNGSLTSVAVSTHTNNAAGRTRMIPLTYFSSRFEDILLFSYKTKCPHIICIKFDL